MELSEKLQKLRKEKGITQEEFAERLFVSRTAVSKWETGRGIPSIESLKMIAKFYEISLDELLSSNEIIKVAEKENEENINRFSFFVEGILNILAFASVFLPLYKIKIDGIFYSVPLYQFGGWLAPIFWILPVLMTVCGILQIFINNRDFLKFKTTISLIGGIINIVAVFLLIISSQPYPSVIYLALFLVKLIVIVFKRR